MSCSMCLNARIDSSLTDNNDFSSFPVGHVVPGYRLSIDSGAGRPVSFCVTVWNDHIQRNVSIATYRPKYCPNCGRQLSEYD